MTAEEQADAALGMIEATNSLADSMDAMKCALEARGWSTPVSERVGAQFGSVLFGMARDAQRPQEPS
jgi:hypothetical protein